MKNLFIPFILGLGAITASANSCLDPSTLTGLSDSAVIEIKIDKFQQGYIDDYGFDIELVLDINLQSYDIVSISEKGTFKGSINHGLENIDSLNLVLDDQKEIKLHKVNAKLDISMADFHKELYSVPNPHHAEIKFDLNEHDYTSLNDEIGGNSLSIKKLRSAALKYDGRGGFTIPLSNSKMRSKAIVHLNMKCPL